MHRLITKGTVEERVAELLQRKRALSDAVLGGGEAALTELDDAELRDRRQALLAHPVATLVMITSVATCIAPVIPAV